MDISFVSEVFRVGLTILERSQELAHASPLQQGSIIHRHNKVPVREMLVQELVCKINNRDDKHMPGGCLYRYLFP